jgi:hypothetical protein
VQRRLLEAAGIRDTTFQPDKTAMSERFPFAKTTMAPTTSARNNEMPRPTPEEERLTEDEIARRKLGPRGVPGGQDFAKMTPQQEKNIPKTGEFDGHTA